MKLYRSQPDLSGYSMPFEVGDWVGCDLRPAKSKVLVRVKSFAWDHVKKDDTFFCTVETVNGTRIHTKDKFLFSLEDIRKEYERVYGEF